MVRRTDPTRTIVALRTMVAHLQERLAQPEAAVFRAVARRCHRVASRCARSGEPAAEREMLSLAAWCRGRAQRRDP